MVKHHSPSSVELLGPQENEAGPSAALARIGVVSVGAEVSVFSGRVVDVFLNNDRLDDFPSPQFKPESVWLIETEHLPVFPIIRTITEEYEGEFSLLSGDLEMSEFQNDLTTNFVAMDRLNVPDIYPAFEGWGDWSEWRGSFDHLPADEYVDPNDPIRRFRRFGQIELDFHHVDNGIALRLMPGLVFRSQHQDESNQYLSDQVPDRRFEPLEPEVVYNDLFIQTVMAIYDRLPEHIKEKLGSQHLMAKITVQQFDVRTNPDGSAGSVTPEGDLISSYRGHEANDIDVRVHKDGMDLIAVQLIEKSDNLEGGEVYVAHLDGSGQVDELSLEQPGQMYMINEMAPDEGGERRVNVAHGVNPIYTTDGKEGYRRVMIYNVCLYEPDEFFQMCSSMVNECLKDASALSDQVVQAAVVSRNRSEDVVVPFKWAC